MRSLVMLIALSPFTLTEDMGRVLVGVICIACAFRILAFARATVDAAEQKGYTSAR
jgi:hypothetical protein